MTAEAPRRVVDHLNYSALGHGNAEVADGWEEIHGFRTCALVDHSVGCCALGGLLFFD